MALSVVDLLKGIDFTALASAAAGDHNTLVDNAEPILDSASEGKGIVLWTKDSALNTPIVPNPVASAPFNKWKRYVWLRIPHSTASSKIPLWYAWNDDAASVGSLLKWQRVTADTTAVEALITALDTRVDTVETDVANAVNTANAANANAATASTNASAAVTTANAAGTNATTALATANTAQTDATAAAATATAANTLATTANNSAVASAAAVAALTTASASFTSNAVACATIVAAGLSINVAHGLGAYPTKVIGYLVCTTADLNYSVGDKLPLEAVESVSGGGNGVTVAVGFSVTNVFIVSRSAAANWVISNKTTGVATFIDPNDWSVEIYAQK